MGTDTGYLDGTCEVPLMPQPRRHFLDRERRADYTPFAGIEQLRRNTSGHVGGGEERRSIMATKGHHSLGDSGPRLY